MRATRPEKPEWVVLRYQGRVYRIEKQPFENNHVAHERAWYIVTRAAAEGAGGSGAGAGNGAAAAAASYPRLVADSCRHMNEKHLGMRYKKNNDG